MLRNTVVIAVAGLVISAGGWAKAEDAATHSTDEQITQSVKQKLANDEPTVAARILVSTHDGVVTLMGRELTPDAIHMAVQDALATTGVVRVENRMKLG